METVLNFLCCDSRQDVIPRSSINSEGLLEKQLKCMTLVTPTPDTLFSNRMGNHGHHLQVIIEWIGGTFSLGLRERSPNTPDTRGEDDVSGISLNTAPIEEGVYEYSVGLPWVVVPVNDTTNGRTHLYTGLFVSLFDPRTLPNCSSCHPLVTLIGREKCTGLITLLYTGHRGVAETSSASHLMWECTPITLRSVVPLTRLWIHLERGRWWAWAGATRTFCALFSRPLSASCYNHTQLTLSRWVSVLVPLAVGLEYAKFEYGREWVRILCPSILEGRPNISVSILINSH